MDASGEICYIEWICTSTSEGFHTLNAASHRKTAAMDDRVSSSVERSKSSGKLQYNTSTGRDTTRRGIPGLAGKIKECVHAAAAKADPVTMPIRVNHSSMFVLCFK